MIVTCLLGLKKVSLTYLVCSLSVFWLLTCSLNFYFAWGSCCLEEMEEESRCFLLKAAAGHGIVAEGSNN